MLINLSQPPHQPTEKLDVIHILAGLCKYLWHKACYLSRMCRPTARQFCNPFLILPSVIMKAQPFPVYNTVDPVNDVGRQIGLSSTQSIMKMNLRHVAKLSVPVPITHLTHLAVFAVSWPDSQLEVCLNIDNVAKLFRPFSHSTTNKLYSFCGESENKKCAASGIACEPWYAWRLIWLFFPPRESTGLLVACHV